MNKLLVLAAMAGLVYLGYSHLFGTEGGAFDADGEPSIVLFTFDACGSPCSDALQLLRIKQVAFEHLNLSRGPEVEERLKALGGGHQMPLLFAGTRRVESFHRQRFNEALAEVHGLSILDARDRAVLKTHFNAEGTPRVVMYGASWCPHTREAREYLQREGIAFKEWDVEQDATGKGHYEVIKSAGYPLIYVGFRRFEGLDKSGIKQALESRQRALGSHQL
ncbi:MAG: glutaredoxin domain-containing protein [Cellvibrionaceae bacterium]